VITYQDIEIFSTIQISKNDFKDLGSFLINNDLLDSRNLWFAGFYNPKNATNNAIAENLFYGNKH